MRLLPLPVFVALFSTIASMAAVQAAAPEMLSFDDVRGDAHGLPGVGPLEPISDPHADLVRVDLKAVRDPETVSAPGSI